jgi:hypothetical protein
MTTLEVALDPPREGDQPDLVAGIAKALNVKRGEVEALWRKNVLDAR